MEIRRAGMSKRWVCKSKINFQCCNSTCDVIFFVEIEILSARHYNAYLETLFSYLSSTSPFDELLFHCHVGCQCTVRGMKAKRQWLGFFVAHLRIVQLIRICFISHQDFLFVENTIHFTCLSLQWNRDNGTFRRLRFFSIQLPECKLLHEFS